LIKEIFQTLELVFGLERNSKQRFIDLGSGNGSVVIFAAFNHNIKSYGIEINQNLNLEAKTRIKSLRKEGNFKRKLFKNLKIKLGDFYLLRLKNYEFIYIYSIPAMQRFLKHVFYTARKGAIIISHKYALKGFNSILKEEYRLSHKNGKQEICTFFYKKIL
jgi:cyclopropane fatty-acyl-phospholipid synthase-like methyltransferase